MNVTNLIIIWDRIICKCGEKNIHQNHFRQSKKQQRPSQQIKTYSVKPALVFSHFAVRPHFCDPIKGASIAPHFHPSLSLTFSLSLSLLTRTASKFSDCANYLCESIVIHSVNRIHIYIWTWYDHREYTYFMTVFWIYPMLFSWSFVSTTHIT